MNTAQFFRKAGSITPGSRPARVLSFYESLQQSQWAHPEAICNNQITQLQALLRHCVAHVPYYRDSFAAAGVTPDDVQTMEDLRRLPRIDRHEYVRNAGQLQALALPTGTERTGVLSTSGTTGVPVLIQNTNVVAERWLAFALRDMEWCRISPQRRLAAIRPSGKHGAELAELTQGVTLPTWGQALANIVETGPSHFMDMAADADQQMAWLTKVNPDYLLSFPSNAEFLARLARDRNVRLPNLKAVQTIGGMLDADMRAVIETTFGVPVFDTYSCCEAGYVASPCPEGHGYHVHAENVIVEVLNDANEPCRPGETGRIVLTTLHNDATPFIRYDIHDEATVGSETCSCGRGLPLLTAIHGRRRPMFQLPNGSSKSSSQAAKIAREVGGFVQFQIAQTSVDRVSVRIVPDRSWTPQTNIAMCRELGHYFGAGVTINVECMDRIPSPAQGKLQSTVVETLECGDSAPLSFSETLPVGTSGPISTRNQKESSDESEHSKAAPHSPCEVVYACSTISVVSETLRSAKSFAALMPDARRILYATADVASELPDAAAFQDIRVVENPQHHHRPRFESMLQCTADRALFLDGDTLLLEPIDDLFELLDHFDIALASAPQQFHSQAVAMKIYEKLPPVSSAIPEWNGGVIAARVTDRFRKFVSRWSDLFTQCQQLGYSMDQAALRSALAHSDLRIATIPTNYNFRANMPQTIKGKVKLLHAHGDRVRSRFADGSSVTGGAFNRLDCFAL